MPGALFDDTVPAPAAYVEVAVPTPVDRLFDYAVPAPLAARAKTGHRVRVPFGRRSLIGIVVAEKATTTLAPSQVREVLEAPDDDPLVHQGMLNLTRWMAEYYACSWGEALQAVLPAVVRTGRKRKTRLVLRLTRATAETLAHAAELEAKAESAARKKPGGGQRALAHARILRALATFTDREFSPTELAEKLGLSVAPMNTLRREGWLAFEKVEVLPEFAGGAGGAETAPRTLTPDQQHALAAVAAAIARDEYRTFLLFGVTGSGKTEVYIRAIEQALAAGKSAIVLVPEIALTPQTTRRFASRLAGVSVLHSAMTDAERRDAWREISQGRSRVVVGPRSALFAPVRDLGLVVVDEEHEGSYKQDNTPRYHARDTAVMRARLERAVVILGSATPSLESWHNAQTGKYELIELRSRVTPGRAQPEPAVIADGRLPDAGLASVEIIDMGQECREQQAFTFFSRRLRGAVAQALEQGRQAIVFLNRRGYHTLLSCRNCGQAMMCPHCAIPMSWHRGLRKMTCHYCLETADLPRQCPACHGGPVKLMGMGTERLEEELRTVFAPARVARMDSDVMKTRQDYESTLEAFRAGETQVLVGTQMIAKGLDFPNVT
ncbi:MAG: primosomal protein N', partial [Planctomycetes bacterium]|nr:primosomal protein N' [Planctomycetota bacterium]